MDEDFSLTKIEDSTENKISNEIFNLTQQFAHVVITSRNQFFRENKVIKQLRDKIKMGQEEFLSETIFLLPFFEPQIEKFLKNRFSKKDRLKARQVIEYIGEGGLDRQLLIANVDKLFGVLENKEKIKEAKTYYLYHELVNNWKRIEQGKVRKKVLSIEDERVTVFDHTSSFCKLLAKNFYEQKRSSYSGFTFEELETQLDTLGIKKGRILPNRTFLVLDTNDRYRFAHQFIYQFYLGLVAIENQSFFDNYYLDSIQSLKISQKIYQQGGLLKIKNLLRELSKEELICDVQYTTNNKELEEYSNQICFEPYFFLKKDFNGKSFKTSYHRKEWTYFLELNKNLGEVTRIKGIKFICDEEEYSNHADLQKNDTLRIAKRKKALSILRPYLRFFYTPVLIDFSEMGEDISTKDLLLPTQCVNFRNNRSIVFSSCKYPRYVSIRGIKEIQFEHNLETEVIVLDFSEKIFDWLTNKTIIPKNKLYIYFPKAISGKNFHYAFKHILFARGKFEIMFFNEEGIINLPNFNNDAFPDLDLEEFGEILAQYKPSSNSEINELIAKRLMDLGNWQSIFKKLR